MNKIKLLILLSFVFIAVLAGIFLVNIVKLNNNGQIDYNNLSLISTSKQKSEEFFDQSDKKEERNESLLTVSESLNFIFFGDIMLDRNVAAILEDKTMADLLAGLIEDDEDFFVGRDIISANLEGAVTKDGAHYKPVNKYDFAFSPEKVAELKDYNFNYFALANNHFNDQGDKGLQETRKNLSDLGFYYSGAPDAQINEYSRKDINIKDKKVAMISLAMVYNNFNQEEAFDLVSSAKQETDIVIINIHWGNEYEHYFTPHQQKIGRILIDAGADIIVGHHPHVVQGLEIYKERPIFYSLGNFIFDQYFSADTQEGLALEFIVSSDNIIILLFPFKSSKSAAIFIKNEDRSVFLEKFTNWSNIEEEIKSQIKNGRLQINLD
jgi:hypothetical protein